MYGRTYVCNYVRRIQGMNKPFALGGFGTSGLNTGGLNSSQYYQGSL